jgi:hypothetical protein
MSFSDWAENKIIDHIFGGGGDKVWTAPSNLWIAVSTSTPSDTVFAEPAGQPRLQVACTTGNWARTANNVTNNVIFYMPSVTSGYTALGWGIYDASTGGNLVCWGTMSSTVLATSDILQFSVGQLSITID